jgi:hypothetical protein
MFHIKTDIRQYKCESEEKVERLIRNWVIRPSDLIYDAREDAWESIGEHAAFHQIFALIEKEEANEPDTVVTEAPSEIAAEYEVAPGTEQADEAHTDDSRPDDSCPDESSRLEDDETMPIPKPQPPEAPEGVEGLIRDSDEITMMTDKTLDMLREEADNAPEEAADDDEMGDEAPLGRHGLPEEVFVTDEIHREVLHSAVLDELGALDDEEDQNPPEDEDAEDDEITQLVERDQYFDDDASDEDDADEDEEAGEDEADAQPADDAPADEEPDDDGDGKARWRIVMSQDDLGDEDAPEEDRGDEELSDEDAEDAGAEKARPKKAGADPDRPLDDDELDEMLNEAAALVGLNADASGDDSEEDSEEDSDLEGADAEDAEFADEEDADVEEIDADALDPVDDDEFDDEHQPRDRAETPVHHVTESEAFVSDGYKIALPIDVSPSAEDLRLGLKHSRLGRQAKDAVFPHPKPKEPGQLEWREFDLDPPEPRDHSLLLVAGFALFLAIVLLAAITIFG